MSDTAQVIFINRKWSVFFGFLGHCHDRAPPQRLYPDFSDRVAPSVDIKASLSSTH